VVRVDIAPSAFRHGVGVEAILHAVKFALIIDPEFEGEDSPKVLVLGPDQAGNMIEVIGRFGDEDGFFAFHAMPARTSYLQRLQRKEHEQ
jgi:hypothetical protein